MRPWDYPVTPPPPDDSERPLAVRCRVCGTVAEATMTPPAAALTGAEHNLRVHGGKRIRRRISVEAVVPDRPPLRLVRGGRA